MLDLVVLCLVVFVLYKSVINLYVKPDISRLDPQKKQKKQKKQNTNSSPIIVNVKPVFDKMEEMDQTIITLRDNLYNEKKLNAILENEISAMNLTILSLRKDLEDKNVMVLALRKTLEATNQWVDCNHNCHHH